jgi:hypothetical protein
MVHRVLFLNKGHLDARPTTVADIAITNSMCNNAIFVSSDKFSLPDITSKSHDIHLQTFPGNQFDTIVLTVNYYEDPYRVHPSLYPKVWKWLKPKGQFIVEITHDEHSSTVSNEVENPLSYVSVHLVEVLSKNKEIQQFIKKSKDPLWQHMLEYAIKGETNIPEFSRWVEKYSKSQLKLTKRIGKSFVFTKA